MNGVHFPQSHACRPSGSRRPFMLFSWKKPILSCLMPSSVAGSRRAPRLPQKLAKPDRDLARSLCGRWLRMCKRPMLM